MNNKNLNLIKQKPSGYLTLIPFSIVRITTMDYNHITSNTK